jgi:hypothetical protein
VVSDIICAVLRISRISLNDGATNLRHEIARRESWATKAASRKSGVKKVPTEGTRKRSLERSGVPARSLLTEVAWDQQMMEL